MSTEIFGEQLEGLTKEAAQNALLKALGMEYEFQHVAGSSDLRSIAGKFSSSRWSTNRKHWHVGYIAAMKAINRSLPGTRADWKTVGSMPFQPREWCHFVAAWAMKNATDVKSINMDFLSPTPTWTSVFPDEVAESESPRASFDLPSDFLSTSPNSTRKRPRSPDASSPPQRGSTLSPGEDAPLRMKVANLERELQTIRSEAARASSASSDELRRLHMQLHKARAEAAASASRPLREQLKALAEASESPISGQVGETAVKNLQLRLGNAEEQLHWSLFELETRTRDAVIAQRNMQLAELATQSAKREAALWRSAVEEMWAQEPRSSCLVPPVVAHEGTALSEALPSIPVVSEPKFDASELLTPLLQRMEELFAGRSPCETGGAWCNAILNAFRELCGRLSSLASENASLRIHNHNSASALISARHTVQQYAQSVADTQLPLVAQSVMLHGAYAELASTHQKDDTVKRLISENTALTKELEVVRGALAVALDGKPPGQQESTAIVQRVAKERGERIEAMNAKLRRLEARQELNSSIQLQHMPLEEEPKEDSKPSEAHPEWISKMCQSWASRSNQVIRHLAEVTAMETSRDAPHILADAEQCFLRCLCELQSVEISSLSIHVEVLLKVLSGTDSLADLVVRGVHSDEVLSAVGSVVELLSQSELIDSVRQAVHECRETGLEQTACLVDFLAQHEEKMADRFDSREKNWAWRINFLCAALAEADSALMAAHGIDHEDGSVASALFSAARDIASLKLPLLCRLEDDSVVAKLALRTSAMKEAAAMVESLVDAHQDAQKEQLRALKDRCEREIVSLKEAVNFYEHQWRREKAVTEETFENVQEEEAIRKKEEEAIRKKEEEATRLAQEEEAIRKKEEEATRLAQEEEATRKKEEEATRLAQEEAQTKAQEAGQAVVEFKAADDESEHFREQWPAVDDTTVEEHHQAGTDITHQSSNEEAPACVEEPEGSEPPMCTADEESEPTPFEPPSTPVDPCWRARGDTTNVSAIPLPPQAPAQQEMPQEEEEVVTFDIEW